MRRNPSQFVAGPRGRGTVHRLETIVRGAALLVASVLAVVATAAAATVAPVATVALAATAAVVIPVAEAVRRRRVRSRRTQQVCVPKTGTCVEV